MPRAPCVICGQRQRVGLLFCKPCSESWDEDAERDNSFAAAVVWAATRVRSARIVRAERVEALARELIAASKNVTRCDSCSNIATRFYLAAPSECFCDDCIGDDLRDFYRYGLTRWADAARALAAELGARKP